LCETNPGLTFQDLVARELKAAGVDATALMDVPALADATA
jgi:hypothetical protein